MKTSRIASNDEHLFLELPWGRIAIGPGTVPTSPDSVSKTSIKDVIAAAREASKLGIYDSAEQVE